MVRYSVNIPQDTNEELKSLSKYYKKDINEIINESIEAISFKSRDIINTSKEYKVPVKLTTVVTHLLNAGFNSTNSLSTIFLEELEAKGLFSQEKMGIDFDDYRVWIQFGALHGCDLYIDLFTVRWPVGADLEASFYLDIEEIDDSTYRKMLDDATIVPAVEDFQGSESFYFLDSDCNVEVEDGDEFLSIHVSDFEEDLGLLPSIQAISEFIKQLMENAGVNTQTHARKLSFFKIF